MVGILIIALIAYGIYKILSNKDDSEQEESNKLGIGVLIGIVLFIVFLLWRIQETT